MPTSLETPKGTEEPGFRLTGAKFLAIMIVAFGFVFAVNGYMLWRAIGSHPGTVTESSFRDSQRFNHELAAAAAQAERAWKVEVATVRAADGTARITVEARDREGRPLSGVAFTARLEHPADRHRDHAVELKAVAGSSDRWEAVVPGVELGKWGVVVEAHSGGERLFLSHNTVFFQ